MADFYPSLTNEQCIERISEIKAKEGDKLVILGHHYQRQDIISVSDIIGDSFELSRKAAALNNASTIAFCGVHFMAESAFLLAPPGRSVYLPDIDAGCPMADMADISQVEKAWQQLEKALGEEPAIPLVYMNSSAAIKAFCGKHGGAVCTSSNAQKVLQWAFEKGKRVLFLPDEHLGRNTANNMGIVGDDVVLWRPYSESGGVEKESLEKSRLILWKGFCIVHQNFTVDDVKRVRNEHPQAKIYVHPECKEEVVKLSDGNGSTSYLVKVAAEAPAGSEVCIGTEVHLVDRLTEQMSDKKVFPLRRSECANMAKITPKKLLHTLETLDENKIVTVKEEYQENARLALQRMLDICS